jgi:hypothetical protein
MKKFLTVVLIVILAANGCTNYRNVDIKSVQLSNLKFISTSKASIELSYIISNPTSSTIILSSGNGIVTRKGVDFAQLEVVRPDTLLPGSVKSGKIEINALLVDPLPLLSMGLNIQKWKVEDFKLSTKLVFKNARGGKKTLRYKDIPLKNLINRL